MNARIDLPSRDNVISLLDLLDQPPKVESSERKTVAQLHTLPQASQRPPVRERARVQPSLSPIDLVHRAGRIGLVTAGVGAACTLAYALATTGIDERTPWLIAFVGLLAFSFGASFGSLSSLFAQRGVALETARVQRERGR